MNLDVEIRKLPTRVIFDLCQILDSNECWKELMVTIPSEFDSGNPKYNVEHMNLIESAGEKQRRSCSAILLEEWGTSGKKRPHLSDLLNALVKAELFRGAEYVSDLLKCDPPTRPSEGPAARVIIPEVLPSLQSQTSLTISDWGSQCQKETKALSQKEDLMTNTTSVKHVSYGSLEEGTLGFSESRRLGAGGFGSVYLCITNEESTAVKRLSDSGFSIQGIGEAQFENEILHLGSLNHPNLVKLLAYSTDGPFPCLVYELMPNGSLQDALECKGGKGPLSWDLRLDIAIGTSRGLDYLHTHKEKPLIHRDIKSANVLLDKDFTPKVGDFGLAKQGSLGGMVTMNTSTVVGTSAYMAPEAFRGDVSTKGDIFSFGVVLLEIITGLPPYDENREGCDLASHVDEVEDITSLIDQCIPPHRNLDLPFKLYEIAQTCLKEKKNRPTSTALVHLLEKLKQLLEA